LNRAIFIAGALAALASYAGEVRAQAPAQDASRPARQSWTADRRAFGEGDVLTVVVDEYALASQHKGTSAESSRSRDSDLSASQNILKNPAIPASGAVRVGSGTRGLSRERGDAVRENAFRGDVTVRVVGVEPNGLLRVEGSKKVDVDRSVQEIRLSGLVRPQDVSAQNVVESWRVADMDLRFASRGSLGKPKGGIVSRLLGMLWP
jgi:flagellar L-ring protein precursor FlgH